MRLARFTCRMLPPQLQAMSPNTKEQRTGVNLEAQPETRGPAAVIGDIALSNEPRASSSKRSEGLPRTCCTRSSRRLFLPDDFTRTVNGPPHDALWSERDCVARSRRLRQTGVPVRSGWQARKDRVVGQAAKQGGDLIPHGCICGCSFRAALRISLLTSWKRATRPLRLSSSSSAVALLLLCGRHICSERWASGFDGIQGSHQMYGGFRKAAAIP